MRKDIEKEFLLIAEKEKLPIGSFIAKKETVNSILNAYYNRIETFKISKQMFLREGFEIKPSVGEIKFRSDDERTGTFFSPSFGLIVKRIKLK